MAEGSLDWRHRSQKLLCKIPSQLLCAKGKLTLPSFRRRAFYQQSRRPSAASISLMLMVSSPPCSSVPKFSSLPSTQFTRSCYIHARLMLCKIASGVARLSIRTCARLAVQSSWHLCTVLPYSEPWLCASTVSTDVGLCPVTEAMTETFDLSWPTLTVRHVLDLTNAQCCTASAASPTAQPTLT